MSDNITMNIAWTFFSNFLKAEGNWLSFALFDLVWWRAYCLDEAETVCEGPSNLRGLRLAELGLHLRTQCHPGLERHDYLFFVAIGFVIFAAGTVLAWLMGAVIVLFDRHGKEDEELDSAQDDVKEEDKVWKEIFKNLKLK